MKQLSTVPLKLLADCPQIYLQFLDKNIPKQKIKEQSLIIKDEGYNRISLNFFIKIKGGYNPPFIKI